MPALFKSNGMAWFLTSRAWPPRTSKDVRPFLWSSCFLAFVFTLTLVFKAISDASWDHPGDSQSLALKGAEGTDSTYVYLHWSEPSDRISSAITWASISLGGAVACASLWASLRAKANGPIHSVRIQRAGFYVLHHLGYALPLATFIYLTYTHAQSDRFSPTAAFSEVDGARTCVGLCSGRHSGEYSGARFDRETWACDLHAAPEVHDPENIALRICVGETAARWSLLVLGLTIVGLAGLLEWDRRGARVLLRSWKVRAMEEGDAGEVEMMYHTLL